MRSEGNRAGLEASQKCKPGVTEIVMRIRKRCVGTRAAACFTSEKRTFPTPKSTAEKRAND